MVRKLVDMLDTFLLRVQVDYFGDSERRQIFPQLKLLVHVVFNLDLRGRNNDEAVAIVKVVELAKAVLRRESLTRTYEVMADKKVLIHFRSLRRIWQGFPSSSRFRSIHESNSAS